MIIRGTSGRSVGRAVFVCVCVGAFVVVCGMASVAAQKREPSTTTRAARNQSVAGSDNSNEAVLGEAATLLKAGKMDEAEAIVRRVVKASTGDANGHNLLGVILALRGNVEEAEREYREALRLTPNSISARANLGV